MNFKYFTEGTGDDPINIYELAERDAKIKSLLIAFHKSLKRVHNLEGIDTLVGGDEVTDYIYLLQKMRYDVIEADTLGKAETMTPIHPARFWEILHISIEDKYQEKNIQSQTLIQRYATILAPNTLKEFGQTVSDYMASVHGVYNGVYLDGFYLEEAYAEKMEKGASYTKEDYLNHIAKITKEDPSSPIGEMIPPSSHLVLMYNCTIENEWIQNENGEETERGYELGVLDMRTGEIGIIRALNSEESDSHVLIKSSTLEVNIEDQKFRIPITEDTDHAGHRVLRIDEKERLRLLDKIEEKDTEKALSVEVQKPERKAFAPKM